SPHRSRPRTTMVSALDAEIAELRSACEPIFIANPSRHPRIFRISKSSSINEATREDAEPARRPASRRVSFRSHTEIDFGHASQEQRQTRSHGRAGQGSRGHQGVLA